LPVWALYMKKVYADSTINLSMEDFEPPLEPISVEIDCDKFEAMQKSTSVILEDEF